MSHAALVEIGAYADAAIGELSAYSESTEVLEVQDGARQALVALREIRRLVAVERAACQAGARALEAHQWQPIETAKGQFPVNKRVRLLVYGPSFGVREGGLFIYADGTFHAYGDGLHGDWPVTHWQPIPDPPALSSLEGSGVIEKQD